MAQFNDFSCDPSLAANGIAFILPLYGSFDYGRLAAQSFFATVPEEFNPILLTVDDASPEYYQQDWPKWYDGLPRERCQHVHWHTNEGLTRSWNFGLWLARELRLRYAVAGNSDVIMTPGWYAGLMSVLDRGLVDLAGPVTNAPGRTRQRPPTQNVAAYLGDYELSDDPDVLARQADLLRSQHPLDRVIVDDINGFFMMSTVENWWRGAFEPSLVFDPSKRMAGNEDELQRRWKQRGWRAGYAPSSFVFHYRSVTRGDSFKTQGWMRRPELRAG